MSATAIRGAITAQIFNYVAEVFRGIGYIVKEEDIVVDFARFNSEGLESTFSLTSIENVLRKPFNQAVETYKSHNPSIAEFKVKFKRPDKNVRFYLKVNSVTQNESSIS